MYKLFLDWVVDVFRPCSQCAYLNVCWEDAWKVKIFVQTIKLAIYALPPYP